MNHPACVNVKTKSCDRVRKGVDREMFKHLKKMILVCSVASYIYKSNAGAMIEIVEMGINLGTRFKKIYFNVFRFFLGNIQIQIQIETHRKFFSKQNIIGSVTSLSPTLPRPSLFGWLVIIF